MRTSFTYMQKRRSSLENMEQPETDETREAAEILVDNMINIMYENPNWDSLIKKSRRVQSKPS